MINKVFISVFVIFVIIFLIIEYCNFFKKTYLSDDEKRSLKGLIWMTITTSMSTIALLCAIMVETHPKAIDVYRGGTELSIRKEIINDSIIKIDTTVKFKDKNIWK